MNKKINIFLLALLISSTVSVLAYDTSNTVLYDNLVEFASRYEYHESDIEKTFSMYPDIPYSSGIEKSKEGKTFEFPAFYSDKDASFFGCFDLQKGEISLSINGEISEYSSSCVLYNGITLIPVSIFENLGCEIEFDNDLYVTTLSKDETILEILPQSIGMRKNRENGYYVPLEVVARFVDDVFYVPLRAIAEEFGIEVSWDGETHTVFLNSSLN